MADKILIYGKDTWPYTKAAREAFKKQGEKVEYHDVRQDADKLKDMLDPVLFVGRSPEQVVEFVEAEVDPILAKYSEMQADTGIELNV